MASDCVKFIETCPHLANIWFCGHRLYNIVMLGPESQLSADGKASPYGAGIVVEVTPVSLTVDFNCTEGNDMLQIQRTLLPSQIERNPHLGQPVKKFSITKGSMIYWDRESILVDGTPEVSLDRFSVTRNPTTPNTL